jgi:hypothetical protein
MFRNKVFKPTLTGFSYRIFIEGLKSAVTKAAYTFALQKYMKYLKIDNPDDLLCLDIKIILSLFKSK